MGYYTPLITLGVIKMRATKFLMPLFVALLLSIGVASAQSSGSYVPLTQQSNYIEAANAIQQVGIDTAYQAANISAVIEQWIVPAIMLVIIIWVLGKIFGIFK